MSLKMPITKRRIQNHFQYSFWKYLLLLVIAIFGWNLIYTTTRYRPPENLKVEFYAEGDAMASDALQVLADRIHQEVMPEMEEVTGTIVTFDDAYGDMQLMVWVSAGQGDIYLLSTQRFANMASNQAMLDLQPFVDEGALNVEGLDLRKGYVTNTDTGKKELVGIPADQLPGLAEYGLLTKDAYLSVLFNNSNDEYTLRFLNYLLTHMRGEEPVASASPSVTVSAEATPAVTPVVTESPVATASPAGSVAPTSTESVIDPTASPIPETVTVNP